MKTKKSHPPDINGKIVLQRDFHFHAVTALSMISIYYPPDNVV